jgi:hypothetical protein
MFIARKIMPNSVEIYKNVIVLGGVTTPIVYPDFCWESSITILIVEKKIDLSVFLSFFVVFSHVEVDIFSLIFPPHPPGVNNQIKTKI